MSKIKKTDWENKCIKELIDAAVEWQARLPHVVSDWDRRLWIAVRNYRWPWKDGGPPSDHPVIKVTSKKAPAIKVTSKRAKTVDPDKVAKALGAERLDPNHPMAKRMRAIENYTCGGIRIEEAYRTIEPEYKIEFIECPTCRTKPGCPVLCDSCLQNRNAISYLKSKIKNSKSNLGKLIEALVGLEKFLG